MSSSPRNTGPANRYGSDGEYGKRRKNAYTFLTRRDFKSSSSSAQALFPGGSSGLASSLTPSLPTDAATNNEYPARTRYRDVVSSGNSSSLSNARSASYLKDSRYPSYGSKYPYTSTHYQQRSSGAYGSFNSTKRAENEALAGHSTSRDVSSRDMVSGPSTRVERVGSAREYWRAERPKPQALNVSKLAAASSRFNPNSILLSARIGLNGLSTSVTSESKSERHDPRETHEETGPRRWNSYSSPRGEKGDCTLVSVSRTRINIPKERIRNSGLTNSVGESKRGDSYHASRTPKRVDGFSGVRYNLVKNDGLGNGSSYASSREFQVKLVSPHSESYYDSERSGESTMSTYDDREREYEEMSAEVDEDEDEDERDGRYDEGPHKDEHGFVKKNYDKLGNMHEDTELSNGSPDATVSDQTLIPLSVSTHENQSSLSDIIAYPDGCVYPQTKNQAGYQDMKTKLAEDADYIKKAASLETFNQDFRHFAFFFYNLRKFSTFYEEYLSILKQRKRALKKKELVLVSEYNALLAESEARRAHMEEQIKVLHPVYDDSRKELEAIDIRVKNPEPETQLSPVEAAPQTGRRGRRHGDSVTTEAEFQEILKSLKNQQNEDPMARARHVAAQIPTLILDPLERQTFMFMDSNNIVQDKSKWQERISTDFRTNFTETEHEQFCDAFCRAPKRFGEISRLMGGLRTFGECVMHYYATKKAVNYKFLVSQYKKKATSKNIRRKKIAKANLESSVKQFETSSSNCTQPFDDIQHQILVKPELVVQECDGRLKRKAEESQIDLPSAKRTRHDDSLPADDLQHERASIFSLIVAEESKRSTSFPEANSLPGSIHNDTVDSNGPVDDKKNIRNMSSYWSITEVEAFPDLLSSYGSRWSKIAEKLVTKSSTMVKNYFQRHAEKYGWDTLVAHVDSALGFQTPEIKQDTEPSSHPVLQSLEVELGDPDYYNSDAPYEARVRDPRYVAFEGTDSGVHTMNGNGFGNHKLSKSLGPPLEASEGSILKTEVQKYSIMSLLNETTPVNRWEPMPFVTRQTNNLSSLLNAPSPAAEPTAETDAHSNRRSNNIESLLR